MYVHFTFTVVHLTLFSKIIYRWGTFKATLDQVCSVPNSNTSDRKLQVHEVTHWCIVNENVFFFEREYVRWVGTLWRVPSFGSVTRSIAKVAWSVGLEISCLTVAVGLVVVLLQILVNEKAHKPEWWSSGRWVPCKWPLCRKAFVTLTL